MYRYLELIYQCSEFWLLLKGFGLLVFVTYAVVWPLAVVFADHAMLLIGHFSDKKRTWKQTGEIFTSLWRYHYWWKIRDFYPTIRAKVILNWHLSSPGKKIDLYLIKKRKDEFHRSLMMDTRVLMYLNKEEKELYNKNLNRRRSIAHELDLHEPLISPIH